MAQLKNDKKNKVNEEENKKRKTRISSKYIVVVVGNRIGILRKQKL